MVSHPHLISRYIRLKILVHPLVWHRMGGHAIWSHTSQSHSRVGGTLEIWHTRWSFTTKDCVKVAHEEVRAYEPIQSRRPELNLHYHCKELSVWDLIQLTFIQATMMSYCWIFILGSLIVTGVKTQGKTLLSYLHTRRTQRTCENLQKTSTQSSLSLKYQFRWMNVT